MSALSADQLHYLDHLGIDVWVSRDEFAALTENAQSVANVQSAAANESPAATHNSASAHLNPQHGQGPDAARVESAAQIKSPAQTQSTAQVERAANVASTASAQTAALQIPVSSNVAAPAFPKEALQAAATSETNTKQSSEPVPRFNLQFWCYGSAASNGVWLLSDEENLSREHHMFAHNLAQFIEGKKRKPRHVGIFSWPMLDAPNVDQGAGVAQHYLQQHFSQLQSISAAQTIIAFKGCEKWLSEQAHISVPFTISELLQNPANKKVLWELLMSKSGISS